MIPAPAAAGRPPSASFPDLHLGAVLTEAERRLATAGLPDPRLDAEIMLAHRLGRPRLELPLASAELLTAPAAAAFAADLARRVRFEPVQYILGSAPFHHLSLEVGPGVLIPRPETEILAELVLAAAPADGAVLDLGTGSGAVALAVAAARPDLHVTGVELSPEALAWAVRNRDRLGLGHVELLAGDLFAPVAGRRFDVVAANLPYVRADEWPALPCEIRNWEPRTALVSGTDGLDLIRRTVAAAPAHLRPQGFLFLEISPPQQDGLNEIGRAARCRSCRFHPDLAGRARIAELRW